MSKPFPPSSTAPKPGAHLTPLHIEAAIHAYFKQLGHQQPYAVFLGGSLAPSNLNQTILIGLDPKQLIRVQHQQLNYQAFTPDGLNNETIRLDNADTLFRYLRAHPWTNTAFLFAGYEFHCYCDSALWTEQEKETDDPDLLLIDFEDIGQFDIETQQWQWRSENVLRKTQYEVIWQNTLQNESAAQYDDHATITPESYAQEFTASLSSESFENAVQVISSHIEQGDLYQANLSLSLQKDVQLECPFKLYEYLCRKNPSPFSAFLKTPESIIISNSPERLLSGEDNREQGLTLETRPIAGTRGRGDTQKKDREIADKLRTNPKERAEHLMLVDLLRNDLGKVCVAGSVHVDELLTIERYSHVMHLVSNVSGLLGKKHDVWDALRALFPGGTITGCPKIRCIQILETLEPHARGFYTGSLGYLNLSKDKPWGKAALDWNILIRTLKLTPLNLPTVTEPAKDKTAETTLPYNATSQSHATENRYRARLQVGAGIVADSIAAHEYRECYRKAQALLGALYVTEQPPNNASNIG